MLAIAAAGFVVGVVVGLALFIALDAISEQRGLEKAQEVDRV